MVANHKGGGGLKEGSEADIDSTACQTVKGQCEELKDRVCFSQCAATPPHLPDELGRLSLHQ